MSESKIDGYKELTPNQIYKINELKRLQSNILEKVQVLDVDPLWFTANADISPFHGLADKRWLAIGKTHIEQGFMALVKAIVEAKG